MIVLLESDEENALLKYRMTAIGSYEIRDSIR
jgi:hypothetical protein